MPWPWGSAFDGAGARLALRRGGGPGFGLQLGRGLADLLQPRAASPFRCRRRNSLIVRKSGGSPGTIIMKSVRSTAARAIRRDEERRLTQTARVPGFYCRQANRPRALGPSAMLA